MNQFDVTKNKGAIFWDGHDGAVDASDLEIPAGTWPDLITFLDGRANIKLSFERKELVRNTRFQEEGNGDVEYVTYVAGVRELKVFND